MMQINDSGLKIFSVEDLQSAAEKSVQFSKVVKMGAFQLFPSFPLPFPFLSPFFTPFQFQPETHN